MTGNASHVPHSDQANIIPTSGTRDYNLQVTMNFCHLSPLTCIFRQGCRDEEPLDEYADQYLFAPGPLLGLSFDDMATNPRRDHPFRMRRSVVQDFDWSAFSAGRLPIDAFPARTSDGLPMRACFMDVNLITDVLDEETPSTAGIENRRRGSTGNEDPLSSLDFIDYDYPEKQRHPETRRPTLSPRSGSSYRYGDLKTRERQFRNMARRISSPGADGCRDWNPKSGAQKDNALPFGKAMQWLHEGPVEAEKFYKKFLDDYHREVRSIKYAGAGILQKLWVKKVTGKGAPGQDVSQDRKPAEKWEEKFGGKKRLHEAMEAVLNASLILGEQESPKFTTLEARKRLEAKIETAGHHVMELLELGMKGSEYCKALLGELKLLKDLLDPKKENKSLFEGVHGGDARGCQDNGGSNDGGDFNNDEGPYWEQTSPRRLV